VINWPTPNSGSSYNIYEWGETDVLRAYKYKYNVTPPVNPNWSDFSGTITAPTGQPQGAMSLSSNGTAPGTGIVWATNFSTSPTNGESGPVTGILYAFNAETLGAPLWESDLDTGDPAYTLAKFAPPMVANGRVYVPTFSNSVQVYGCFQGAPECPFSYSPTQQFGPKGLYALESDGVTLGCFCTPYTYTKFGVTKYQLTLSCSSTNPPCYP
jgi:hypothetical protein